MEREAFGAEPLGAALPFLHQALTDALTALVRGNGNGVHVGHSGTGPPEHDEASWLTAHDCDQRFCANLTQQAGRGVGSVRIELAEGLLGELHRKALVRPAGFSNLECGARAGVHALA